MLTLGSAIAWNAGAAGAPCGKCTAPSVVAEQLPAGHASLTVGPSVTLQVEITYLIKRHPSTVQTTLASVQCESTLTSWHVQAYPSAELLDTEHAPPFSQG